MRQQTFKKSGDRRDDGLPALTAKNQRLSCDPIVAKRTSSVEPKPGAPISEAEDYFSFGVRDAYSGAGLCNPRNSRAQAFIYQDLKSFVGPTVVRNTPQMLVKSDAAPEILGAVHDLGWHSEPSLANNRLGSRS